MGIESREEKEQVGEGVVRDIEGVRVAAGRAGGRVVFVCADGRRRAMLWNISNRVGRLGSLFCVSYLLYMLYYE